MNPDNLARAQALAQRPYRTLIIKDDSPDGTVCYIAKCLTLHGCITDGNTIEDAYTNILSARVDFIHSLLDDNQPIPVPDFRDEGEIYIGWQWTPHSTQTYAMTKIGK